MFSIQTESITKPRKIYKEGVISESEKGLLFPGLSNQLCN